MAYLELPSCRYTTIATSDPNFTENYRVLAELKLEKEKEEQEFKMKIAIVERERAIEGGCGACLQYYSQVFVSYDDNDDAKHRLQ